MTYLWKNSVKNVVSTNTYEPKTYSNALEDADKILYARSVDIFDAHKSKPAAFANKMSSVYKIWKRKLKVLLIEFDLHFWTKLSTN